MDNKLDYNNYNKVLNCKIVFKFDSVEINDVIPTKHDRALLLCDIYFGNVNDRENSLISMNIIFEYVLLLISSNDHHAIRKIVHSPTTKLSQDTEFIECTAEFSSIGVVINLTKSSPWDEEYVNRIFQDNGFFVNKA